MQAVYSTTTDVKIHKAIRREWDGFLAWLVARQHEIQSRATGQKPTKLQRIQEEFLNEARTKWLACVRARQLHIEHWIMTPEQKAMVQRTLGWTQKDMVDAYAAEQAALGAQYQVVDPVTLGTNEPVAESSKQAADSPRRYMHPKPNTKVPAYANWAAELGKIASPAAYRSPGKQLHESSPHIAELPTMPLYFVGALMHGTDLDAVAAAELEAFALGTSEEKIREYYAEACDATLRFQRHIGGLDEIQREAAHAGFEDRMRELAAAKEREWKLRVLKEMRKHQAAEVQRRAAQHHAMRPRTSPRVPPGRHRDDDRWDHPEEFRQYRSPRGEHLDPYYSPRGMAHQAYDDYGYGDDYGYELPVYNSPRQGKTKQKPKKEKQKRKQQPPQTAVETHQHPQDLDDPQYYLEQRGARLSGIRLLRRPLADGGRQTWPKSRRIPPGTGAEVLVDEMASRRTKTYRHADDLFFRLDGTAGGPTRTASKLIKKRHSQKDKNQGEGEGGRGMVGRWRRSGLRGRVSDEAGKEKMERQTRFGPQTEQSNTQRDRLGDSLGRLDSPAARLGRVRFQNVPISLGMPQAGLRRPTGAGLSRFVEAFTSSVTS